MREGHGFGAVLRRVLIVFLLLVIGAPLIWMLLSSLQPNAELVRPGSFFSWSAATFGNYARLPAATNYVTFARNSLLVAVFSTVVAIPLALLAAYSVFRTHYRGRMFIYNLLLVVYIFPGVLLLAPLFRLFALAGLLNSLASLVIMNVTFAVPFSVWLMRGFFTSIPAGIEEAAAMDGATDRQILTRIIVPLTAPGIVVTATYTFVLSWTEFMFASVLIIDDRLKTLPVGLEALVSQYSIDWGLLSAAAVAVALPVVLLFALAGRYFVEGITAGSGK